ncbi:MAG: pantoate kinase [Candidatus Hodarchaeota archaeon]
MGRGIAFVPSHISGFFEVCERLPDGNLIANPRNIGSRGAGPNLSLGCKTSVFAERAEDSEIEIHINGVRVAEAETTKTAISRFLRLTNETYTIRVDHEFSIPIGYGYGASGAGALGAIIALSEAIGYRLTANKIGEIAHIAEIECKTGLGTVGTELLGGFTISTKEGAPGFNIIDRIIVPPDLKIISAFYDPILTKTVLSSPERKIAINKAGKLAMSKLLVNPTVKEFILISRVFAETCGLMTEKVNEALVELDKVSPWGASMNMIGEAVFTIAREKHLPVIRDQLISFSSEKNILIADLNKTGARLI